MSLVVLRRLPVFLGVVWPEWGHRQGSRLRRWWACQTATRA